MNSDKRFVVISKHYFDYDLQEQIVIVIIVLFK